MQTATSNSFDPEDLNIVASLQPEGAEPGTPQGYGVSYSTEDGGTQQTTDGAPAAHPAPPVADSTPPADPAATAAPAPAPAPAAAPAADHQAAAPAPAAPAAPADGEKQGAGNLRNALRAARHDARKKDEEIERLRKELEQRRSNDGTGSDNPEDDEDPLTMSEARLAEIERDFPLQAKTIKHLRRLAANAAPAPSPAAPPADEWVPPVAPPAVQAVIDEVPQLLEWQLSRDGQEKFNLAARYDDVLRADPAWKGKTAVERFTEAARRAATHFTAPAAPSAAARAQAAIDATQAQATVGISDFRGGSAAQPPQLDLSRMSDEEILRSLPVQD